MKPEPNDPERAKLVTRLAKNACIKALELQLEHAVKFGFEDDIAKFTDMLQKVVADEREQMFERIGRSFPMDSLGRAIVTHDISESHTRPEKTTCKPEDCDDCYWHFICEAEASSKFLMEAQATINQFNKAFPKDEGPKKMTISAETLADAKERQIQKDEEPVSLFHAQKILNDWDRDLTAKGFPKKKDTTKNA